MGKFGTDIGLFWWKSPKYRTEYRLDLKIKYGRDTIPHTASTREVFITRNWHPHIFYITTITVTPLLQGYILWSKYAVIVTRPRIGGSQRVSAD
jgi:hypothetical protein